MSRKKNRRWFSTRTAVGVDDALRSGSEAAFERQLNAEMQRQIAIAQTRGGNMAGVRLTVKTPVRDLVLEFPETTDE